MTIGDNNHSIDTELARLGVEIDKVEQVCAVHGPTLAQEMRSSLELGELVQAGFDEEDIRIYVEGTKLGEFLHRVEGLESYIETVKEKYSGDIIELFAHPSPRTLAEVAQNIAAELPPYLLEGLSFSELTTLVMSNAMMVATIKRSVPNQRNTSMGIIESSLVNQITIELVHIMDTDAICPNILKMDTLKDGSIHSAAALADYYMNDFNQTYPSDPMNPRFLSSKIDMLKGFLLQSKSIDELITSIPEVSQTPEQFEQTRAMNDEFAKKMGKVRRYDIKSLVFSAEEQGSDRDISYREYRDLEIFNDATTPVRGTENVLAAANIGWPGVPLSPVLKFSKLDKRSSMELDDARVFMLDSDGIVIVDRQGELWFGLGLTGSESPSISMRREFEEAGHETAYEQLRGRMLSNIFDAIAPATIVQSVANAPLVGDKVSTEANEPEDVIRKMVLARLRYMRQPTKLIHREFYQVEQQEKQYIQEQERHLRLHNVASHLRILPPGARPSQKSIEDSKRKWGEDYEIPEGYTFVNNHTRGDAMYGRVLGHQAIKIQF